jgi:hypothetical protein
LFINSGCIYGRRQSKHIWQQKRIYKWFTGRTKQKKKLEVPKEKNEAFLVSVEKLEKVLTIKSYAAAARYARRQETKITENIANFVNKNLQESLKNWKHITIIS